LLGKSVLLGGDFEKNFLKEVFESAVEVVQQSKGENGLSLILGSDVLASLYAEFTMPDWQVT